MKKKKKKRVQRHLKMKPFLLLMGSILFLALMIYFIFQIRIHNIYIDGNVYLSDYEIIKTLEIKDYPKMMKTSIRKMKKKVLSLDIVDQVKITKNLLGQIKIHIKEAIPLFYNRNNMTYVLSNGKETNQYKFTGVPFLVNYVPENIYKRLIKELGEINQESIQMISEIEYSPSKSGDYVIDDNRFLFRMNDGNQVYINLINMDRMDSYSLIYTILTEKGILELDSDNESVVFKSYKSIEENKKREESEKNET